MFGWDEAQQVTLIPLYLKDKAKDLYEAIDTARRNIKDNEMIYVLRAVNLLMNILLSSTIVSLRSTRRFLIIRWLFSA
jgi:hypothetical protein